MSSTTFHAFHDAAEHGIAPAAGLRIERGVVREVDIELRVAAVRIGRARQADRAAPVRQPLPDSLGMPSRVGFSAYLLVVAAGLRDEVGDDAMEDRARVVAARTYSRKFATVSGARAESSSMTNLPMIGFDPHARVAVGVRGRSRVSPAASLENIRNTTDIQYVMKGGILYDAGTLDEIWPEKRPFGDYYWIDPDSLKTDDRPIDYHEQRRKTTTSAERK